MEIIKALNVIESVEAKMATTYSKIADYYADKPEISTFMLNMKLDEESHRELVKMQKRIVSKNMNIFDKGIEIDIDKINATLAMMDDIIANPSRPLAELINMLYSIERSPAELYALSALRNANTPMKEFLSSFANTFRTHFIDLLDFAKQMGIQNTIITDEGLRQMRVPFDIMVTVNESTILNSSDISEGGIFLIADEMLEIGSLVTLDLTIVDEKLKIDAVVRYITEGVGMGLMFLELPDDLRLKLRSLIESIAESEGPVKKPVEEVAPVRSEIATEEAEDIFSHDSDFERMAIKGVKRDKLLFISTGQKTPDLSFYKQSLLFAGFVIIDIIGFNEAVIQLNDSPSAVGIIISIDTEEDDLFKLIELIKNAPKLKSIPLFVLSASENPEFEDKVYSRGADRFLSITRTAPEKLAKILKDKIALQ